MNIQAPTGGATAPLQQAAPSDTSARRFESYLQAPETGGQADLYLAPPALPQLPDSSWLRHASSTSHRMHAAISEPAPAIPEDGVDLSHVVAMMRHTESVALAQLNYTLQTKVVELGTSNLRTLYQMQG